MKSIPKIELKVFKIFLNLLLSFEVKYPQKSINENSRSQENEASIS